MSVIRENFQYISVVLILIFCVSSAQCLQFTDDDDRQLVGDAIQSYFPVEKTLCVVPEESDDEAFLPPFHVTVVVFTQDQLLQGCGEQIKKPGWLRLHNIKCCKFGGTDCSTLEMCQRNHTKS